MSMPFLFDYNCLPTCRVRMVGAPVGLIWAVDYLGGIALGGWVGQHDVRGVVALAEVVATAARAVRQGVTVRGGALDVSG